MINKHFSNRLISFVLCLSMLFTNTCMVMPTKAQEVEKVEKVFIFEKKDTNEKIALNNEDAKFKAYTEEEKTNELAGTANVSGEKITFIPDIEVDKEKTYYFNIDTKSYNSVFGSFKFDNMGDIVELELKQTEDPVVTPPNNDEEKPPVVETKKSVYAFFINDTRENVPLGVIEFFDENSQKITPTLLDGGYDFSSYIGKTITYKVNTQGYKYFESTFIPEENKENEVSKEISVKFDRKPEFTPIIENNRISFEYHPEKIEDSKKISEFVKNISEYDGDTNGLTYEQISGRDVVSISELGEIKLIGTGEAEFTINFPETNNFSKTKSQRIKIVVEKTNIGKIENDDIEWEKAEKIYDGTNEIAVKGKIKKEKGVIGNKDIIVTATAKFESKDAGEYVPLRLIGIKFENIENYNYEIGNIVGPNVVIKKKDVFLSPKPVTVKYGKEDWALIKENKLPKGKTVLDYINIDTELPYSLLKEFKNSGYENYIDIDINSENYYVGEHHEAVFLNINNSNLKNFNIKTSTIKETLTITQEDDLSRNDIMNLIEVDEGNSSGVYIKNGVNYIAHGGILAFKLKDKSLYDQINIERNGVSSLEKNQISIGQDETSKWISGNIYLDNSNSPETKTEKKPIALGTIRVDANYPKIEFTKGEGIHASSNEKEKFENIPDLIKFTEIHGKEGYTLNAKATDNESGIKDIVYTVVEINSDEDAKEKIKKLAFDSSVNWTTSPINEETEIRVDGSKNAFYIALVKATDNVGNTTIAASNGIVIDIESPKVNIVGIEDKVYGNNLNYKIRVTDPEINGVNTGIESIEVVVKNDGRRKPLVGFTRDKTNSFKLTTKDIYENYGKNQAPLTFEDIKNLSGIIEIPCSIDFNSNNISIEVTAYDYAGNKVSSVMKSGIIIDKEKAIVNGYYDKNKPTNQKYFNKGRELKVEIKERNFDEKNLIVEASINGKSGKYTIEQIRNKEVKGIELLEDRKDSEADINKEKYTNDRINSYTLFFGDSQNKITNTYSLNIKYVDESGVSEITYPRTQYATNNFIVDTISPEVNVVYRNGKNNIIQKGKDKTNPVYDSEAISATIEIKEINFNPENVRVQLISFDSQNKPIKTYDLSKLEKNNWVEENGVYRYELTKFQIDANYGLKVVVKDMAENQNEEYEYDYFTVDKTPPIAKVYVSVDGKNEMEYSEAIKEAEKTSGIKKFVYNLFGKNTIYLNPKAGDTTSGVKRMSYVLINAPKDSAHEFDFSLNLDNQDWKEFKTGDKIKIDKDTIGLILIKIEDNAGHITYASSNGAYIVESKNPSAPSITIKENKDIYNEDFTIDISVEDMENGGEGIYSGIKQIVYDVYNEETGKKTQTGKFEEDKPRVKSVNKKVSINKVNNNTNNIKVVVTAYDYVGNKSEKIVYYMMDTTKPIIKASLNKQGVLNEKYYNTKRKIEVEFNERNFNPKESKFSISISGKTYEYTFADLENGNGEAQNIKVISVEDSEKGVSKNKRSDNRKIIYILEIGKNEDLDERYENIKINSVDESGNVADTASVENFVIDNIRPIIKTYYKDTEDVTSLITKNKNTTYRTNKNIELKIAIEENNFNKSGIKIDLTEEDAIGKMSHLYKGLDEIGKANWTRQNISNELILKEFTDDAIYGLTVNYTDLAGNKAIVSGPEYFVVDKTAPSGNIFITTDSGERKSYSQTLKEPLGALKKFFLNMFAKNTIKIENEVFDGVSGIKSIEYAKLDAPIDVSDEFNLSSNFESMNWKNWDKEILINTDTVGAVYMKITDRAGNITYVSSDGAYVLDTGAPELGKPSIIVEEEQKGIYNKDIKLKIKAVDTIKENIYSGIKSLKYEVFNAETTEKTQEETFINEKARIKELGKSIVINAEKNNANKVEVKLTAEDYSGNITTYSKFFFIDKTAPEVTLQMDKSDVKNEKYFNKEKELSIEVKERNFDDELVNISLNINGKKKVFSLKDLKEGKAKDYFIRVTSILDNQKDINEELKTDRRRVVYKVLFGEGQNIEINYNNIKVNARDVAGNVGKEQIFGDFTIDNIAPIIDLKYFQNNVDITGFIGKNKENPYYTNQNIVPVLSISETNFRKDDVIASLTQTDLSNKNVEAYNGLGNIVKKDWSKLGKTNKVTLDKFTNDARYGLKIEYTDLAGNKAEVYQEHYFTIDKTAPDAELFMIIDENKMPYYEIIKDKDAKSRNSIFNVFSNKDIYLSAEYSDKTAGVKSVKYVRVDAQVEAKDNFMALSDLKNFNWIPMSSNIKISKDTAETFYLRVEDKSGNITYLSSKGSYIRDTKNPIEPILKIEGEEKGKYNSNIRVMIKSLDPDNNKNGVYSGIKTLEYKVINNETGETTQEGVFENKKPRIRELSSYVQINTNKNNSNNVELKVIATDYAGNKSEQSAYYAIDTSAPEISINMDESDVKNGKYYNNAKTIEVNIKERNFDPNKATLSLTANGKPHEYTFTELNNGSAKNVAIEVQSVEDNQVNMKENERTDNRLVSYKLKVGSGNDLDIAYSDIRFNVEDEAENKAVEKTLKEFVIDNIAPIIKVDYKDSEDITGNITTNKEVPYYTNKDIVATVTVEENNFRNSDVEGTLIQTNLSGDNVNAYADMGDLSRGSWSRTSNTNTFEMRPFSGDARYAMSINYTDLAGNKAEVYENHYFVVDKTTPVGEITITSDDGTKTYSTLSESGTFEFITNKKATINQKSSDETAGIKSIDYYLYKPAENEKGTFNILGLSGLRDAEWIPWDAEKTLEPNMQCIPYLRIIDRAGNISYISANGGIILDSEKPIRPEIKINTEQSGNDFYNGDITAIVEVNDPVVGETYSGLKDVKVEVLNNDNVTQTETFRVGEKGERVKDFKKEIKVEANKNNTNYIKIRVTVTDWANNVSSGEQAVRIDTTKPRIEINYDINSPLNGKYYNKTRTATIKVYERNFNPSKSIVKINGGKAQVGSWNVGKDSGLSDNNINTLTIMFNEDGDYTFNVDITDYAGNNAKYEETKEFTIDQTRPLINVNYDKSLINGKYINSQRTATVTIREHNFSENGFDASIKAIYAGKGITPPTIGAWSNNGDVHTASIVFAKDAAYSFFLNYTDLAGNKAEQYNGEEFILDTSKTEISFNGIEENSANRGPLNINIGIKDENFELSGITLLLRGYNHEEKRIPISQGMITRTSGGLTVAIPNIPHTKENDDIYTLKVIVKDMAGNIEEKEITFSVNRFGSNYYFEENSQKYLKNYYNKEAKDIIIYEINPDELLNQSVTIIKDSVAKILKPNEFIVEDVSKEGEFKKYKYVISKSLFKEEGQYEIVLNSEDKAGNKQNNKVKETVASFAIDKTSPGAVITGIENKQVYDNQNREIVLSVEDNMYVEKAEILINGKVVKTFDAETIKKSFGKLKYVLSEKETWQKITAKVIDGAGNETETDEISVLISSSSITRFIHGTGLKLTIAGLLGLIGIFILIVLLKRRKDENNEEKEEKKIR